MRGLLVKVGIDQTYGGWTAPCRSNGAFCYIPLKPRVPEAFEDRFQTTFDEFENIVEGFAPGAGNSFPAHLRGAPCHLDPDFRFLSYGESGQRARRMLEHFKGSEDNFIAFYASFMPVGQFQGPLIYALIGLYRFPQVNLARELPEHRREQNAHTRLAGYQQSDDIVIFADPKTSGRLRLLIPIGEWRNFAYRIRRSLLKEWGEISAHDGHIQGDTYLPHFAKPEKFLQWFHSRKPELVAQNNIDW
jgi:hypothetical protein